MRANIQKEVEKTEAIPKPKPNKADSSATEHPFASDQFALSPHDPVEVIKKPKPLAKNPSNSVLSQHNEDGPEVDVSQNNNLNNVKSSQHFEPLQKKPTQK